jgi:hypothetical protein
MRELLTKLIAAGCGGSPLPWWDSASMLACRIVVAQGEIASVEVRVPVRVSGRRGWC